MAPPFPRGRERRHAPGRGLKTQFRPFGNGAGQRICVLTPRFKYVLVNMSTGLVQDQTLWSDPISTKQPAPSSAIDTWPGRRSGGMIVVTAILGSLPFLLLLAFAGAVASSLVGTGDAGGETTHDSQMVQEAGPRPLGAPELSLPPAHRGPALDRAGAQAGKLQA
ncbi:PREDICTED: uroplakin-3a [Condylura cristata]|uniref:uroplakin-3a n=1 Tax=Condylura cristata TaxID=143302 RepID=UPI00033456F8|nr:PREDICTED: uroplakin-3a [Condylura cristata]